MPAWDPDLYLTYADERTRPSIDLVAQIRVQSPKKIVDLGCGTGNSTEQLRHRWPEADVLGIDNSREMLSKARTSHVAWKWQECDIEAWRPEHPVDLVFSNAALHWVPGHATLFRGLISSVAQGGALAVQMPDNFKSPSHTILQQVAFSGDPRWEKELAEAPTAAAVQPSTFYYEVLRKNATQVDIWETEYCHVMDGPKAVFDWVRSTAMRPYLQRLHDEEQRQLFQELCLERFQEAYRPNDQGKVLFPFKRLFIIAYR